MFTAYKHIYQVTTSFHLWLMLHHHQKKRKKKIGLDPGVRPALENPFSSQVQNYLYSTALATDMYYQHIMLFLSAPPCLDTAMTTLWPKSFLSAGNRLVLKTGHFSRGRGKLPTVPVPETQCQMFNKHIFGNLTYFYLYLIVSVTGFPKCIDL